MAKVEAGELSFIDRMEIELKLLDENLVKLTEFTKGEIFKTVTPLEQQLMYIQISVMSTYGATLATRISLAKGKEDA